VRALRRPRVSRLTVRRRIDWNEKRERGGGKSLNYRNSESSDDHRRRQRRPPKDFLNPSSSIETIARA